MEGVRGIMSQEEFDPSDSAAIPQVRSLHSGDDQLDDLGDDELDNALEEQLASLFHRHPGCLPPLPGPALLEQPPILSASPSSLTFAFPDWGVEIFRDPRRLKPSIIRHKQDLSTQHRQQVVVTSENEGRQVSWGDADKPGHGNAIYRMPNEIIVNVMKRLDVKDLCSAIGTCHWWQHVGSQDEVWERFRANNNFKQRALAMPKCGIVKNNYLSAQVLSRVASTYPYFWRGFDHLRSALHAWWEMGRPDDKYSSKSIAGLIRKMTVSDWTFVYECFGVVFAERADCLAATLMGEVEKEAEEKSGTLCPFRCDHVSETGTQEIESKPNCRNIINICKKASLDLDIVSTETYSEYLESLVGRNMWEIVNGVWNRYKSWLMLIFEHCPELNHEVMAEKARTSFRSTTPTIYNKGVICFRSQILLKYGLRRVLQSGFAWLSAHDASGLASEVDVELLQSIYHLLQEVDVYDDSLSPKSFTQPKLRRCFPIRRSYARHFKDRRDNHDCQ